MDLTALRLKTENVEGLECTGRVSGWKPTDGRVATILVLRSDIYKCSVYTRHCRKDLMWNHWCRPCNHPVSGL